MPEQNDEQHQEEQLKDWIRSSHFGRKGVIASFLIIFITGLALAFFGQRGEMNLHLPHQGSPLQPGNQTPPSHVDSSQSSTPANTN